MKFNKTVLIIAASLVCIVALYFHYGLYSYDKLNQKTPIRVNRFTGETWLLSDDGTWKTNKEIQAEAEQKRIEAEKQKAAEQTAERARKDVPLVRIVRYEPDDGSKRLRSMDLIDLNLNRELKTNRASDDQISVYWGEFDPGNVEIKLNDNPIDSFMEEPSEGINEYRFSAPFNLGENVITVKTEINTYEFKVSMESDIQPIQVVEDDPNDKFTIGSSQDEVKIIMGAPTGIHKFLTMGTWWYYGTSYVVFDSNGKVSSYQNNANNLKIK